MIESILVIFTMILIRDHPISLTHIQSRTHARMHTDTDTDTNIHRQTRARVHTHTHRHMQAIGL